MRECLTIDIFEYMKRTFLTLVCYLVALISWAQAPNNFDFQSLVRDENGKFVSNQPIGVKINIRQSTISGTAVYSETHTVSTNENGLLTLTVGAGTKLSTKGIADIDWNKGPYFIQVHMDPKGGTNYTLSSTTQMMSVPYALYAAKAGDYEQRIAALENTIQSIQPYVPTQHTDGFSVAPGRQVKFAKGNLWYDGTKYTIASNQYSIKGSYSSTSCDVFAVANRDRGCPVEYSGTDFDYGVLSRPDIGGNYRMLSAVEFGYILHQRKNADKLWSYATVNGISGMILLPDGWQLPSGITFTAGATSYSKNTYSTTQWKTMETVGAVFLPSIDYQILGAFYSKSEGSYLISSCSNNSTMTFLKIEASFAPTIQPISYCYGPIRLVYDY